MQQDFNEADRLAAQGIGIAGGGGFESDSEEREKVVDFISQAKDDAGWSLWKGSIFGVGLPVFFNSAGNFFVFLLDQGVVFANSALEFRELFDEGGGKVGLAKDGGAQ